MGFDTGGQLVGYARVSTAEQILDRQITELQTAGCERIFTDEAVSGAKMQRPGLDEALRYVRRGDALVVVELSRLGRSVRGILDLTGDLEARGVGLRILNLGMDTTTITGRLVLTILAAVVELERELIRERILSGIAEARRKGKSGGRPPALTGEQRELVAELREQGRSIDELARLFGVSSRTVRRVLDAHQVENGGSPDRRRSVDDNPTPDSPEERGRA
ncbi:MAG: recombinase family protein [Propionicimonas sp.]